MKPKARRWWSPKGETFVTTIYFLVLIMVFQNLVMILPRYFDFERPYLSPQAKIKNWTFGDGRFCVQLCIETSCKRATSVAHLTNFSFEFFYEIFTQDASLLLLHHGAKKSKMTKNSNQGGSCLNPRSRSRFSNIPCHLRGTRQILT